VNICALKYVGIGIPVAKKSWFNSSVRHLITEVFMLSVYVIIDKYDMWNKKNHIYSIYNLVVASRKTSLNPKYPNYSEPGLINSFERITPT
jgi:hypothetical protein